MPALPSEVLEVQAQALQVPFLLLLPPALQKGKMTVVHPLEQEVIVLLLLTTPPALQFCLRSPPDAQNVPPHEQLLHLPLSQ